MKLNDYLLRNNITKTEFSHRTKTTLATISRISDGLVMPRKELLERIYRETEGLVTANDIAGFPCAELCRCNKESSKD